MKTMLAEVVTHLLAFAIFVWILKRFAWKPLLSVLDKRREHIENNINEAEEAKKRALETEEEYKAQLAQADDDVQKRLNEAANEGKELAAKIREDATQRAGDIVKRGRMELEVERNRAQRQLQKEVARLTVASVDQLLRDGLDAQMQRKLIGHMLDQVEGKPTTGAGPKPGGTPPSSGAPPGGGSGPGGAPPSTGPAPGAGPSRGGAPMPGGGTG